MGSSHIPRLNEGFYPLKIDLLKQQDKVDTFLYLERYVNEGSRTYSSFSNHSGAKSEYQPSSDIKSFEVPCLQIPKEKVTIYLDNPSTSLLNHYIQKDTVLFPIHPEVFEDDKIPFIEELRKYPYNLISVAPCSSTRTILTNNEAKKVPFHFVKLHFPRRISRFIRRLRKNTVQHCIEISKDLEHFSLGQFGFLPESIGLVYGSGVEAWGAIIREFSPRPLLEKESRLIPLFALYSQDLKRQNDLPLLVQLIEYLSEEPVNFTLNNIIKPIVNSWCTVLRNQGILLEMHGQNTLLELDANLVPMRIIYRDLDVYVDPAIRQMYQLHLNFPSSHLVKESREKIYSLKYDAFIGHHLFDYIASTLEKFYGVSAKLLQDSCKEAFHHGFPDSNLYFENKTFYYTDEVLPENQTKLIEKNDPPRWR